MKDVRSAFVKLGVCLPAGKVSIPSLRFHDHVDTRETESIHFNKGGESSFTFLYSYVSMVASFLRL